MNTEGMTIPQMREALKHSGIDLTNYPKEKMDKLASLAKKISDPNSPSGMDLHALQQLISPTVYLKKEKRIKPNGKCPCGSGIKYKKCCRP
jgi:uncharacterized protein YecA (UPF0149 family)